MDKTCATLYIHTTYNIIYIDENVFMKPHQNGKYWTEGYVSLVLVLEATVDSASLGESWYLSAFLFQMEIVPGFLPEKIRFIINQRWFLLLRKNILRLRCKTITRPVGVQESLFSPIDGFTMVRLLIGNPFHIWSKSLSLTSFTAPSPPHVRKPWETIFISVTAACKNHKCYVALDFAL